MQYYTYILAFHIISMMSWMAMLFYLPRLYVYHQENFDKKEFVEIVKIQEYKLYKYIGLPAMWATIISGISMLVLNTNIFQSGAWIHAKLSVAVLMIAYSFSLEYYRKQLENDTCTKSGKFFRAYNEIPTVLAILIVTFVILKSVPIYFSIGIISFFIFVMYKIMNPKKQEN